MKSPLPDRVLEQHIAILGKTRAGKSTVLRGLAEDLLTSRQPVCIIDPKGDWWGLKLAPDGTRPGFPVVIFGGEHADVPINPKAGAHVAELFATGNRPCLIDLGGWMPHDRTEFWIDFASSLFRHTKGRRWLIVDEVHNFAPKGRILSPDAGMALHWSNRLASEGLGKGLHLIFASQRPQKVHNDTLTSAETLVAMRVLHPSDREAISDWLAGCGDAAMAKQILGSLAQLDRGEGWAWSPEIGFGPERIRFSMFGTYDSFKPQTAADVKKLKGWASVDLDEVKAKLAAVVEEAKANDPKALKAEIARLKAELSNKATVPDPAALDAAQQAGYQDGYRAGRMHALGIGAGALERLKESGQRIGEALAAFDEGLKDGFAKIRAAEGDAVMQPRPSTGITHARQPYTPTPASRTPVPSTRSSDSSAGLGKGDRLTLTVLAQYSPARVSASKAAAIAGYSVRSSTWRNILSRLRHADHIEEGPEPYAITSSGLAALGPFNPLPTGAALLEHWMARVGKGDRETLRILATLHGECPSSDFAQRAGYSPSSSTWRNILSRLRTLGLIEGSRNIKLHEDLR